MHQICFNSPIAEFGTHGELGVFLGNTGAEPDSRFLSLECSQGSNNSSPRPAGFLKLSVGIHTGQSCPGEQARVSQFSAVMSPNLNDSGWLEGWPARGRTEVLAECLSRLFCLAGLPAPFTGVRYFLAELSLLGRGAGGRIVLSVRGDRRGRTGPVSGVTTPALIGDWAAARERAGLRTISGGWMTDMSGMEMEGSWRELLVRSMSMGSSSTAKVELRLEVLLVTVTLSS